MHQTFTLQTRRQTKRDGVRAEKAEQDACKRPNQDGQACASPRARTHSTADEFSSGAPNSRAGMQLKARATAWLSDSVNPQGRLNRQAGRKRLTGRQKHPTHLA